MIHLNDKILQKTLKVVFFKPFSTGMDLNFFIFLATVKSQKKYKICILDEAVNSQAERKPDRKKTDISQNHHITCRSNKPRRQTLFLKRLF